MENIHSHMRAVGLDLLTETVSNTLLLPASQCLPLILVFSDSVLKL